MPQTILGLPLHPLIVHATVVIVPTAALAVLLAALWPAARRRLGLGTQLVAAAAVALVPLTTASGENLQATLPQNPLIERHAELADGLLPWVVGLAVVAALLFFLDRRERAAEPDRVEVDSGAARTFAMAGDRGTTMLRVAAAVLAAVAATGTSVQVALIGHSGAQAAWHGVGQSGGKSQSGSNDGDNG